MNFIGKLIDKYWTRQKNIDVNKIYVYWKHYAPEPTNPKMDRYFTPGDFKLPGTSCHIKYDGKEVATGRSFMSESETQFNKRIGRKYSFTRAVEQLNLSKEQRTELYNRYLNSIR